MASDDEPDQNIKDLFGSDDDDDGDYVKPSLREPKDDRDDAGAAPEDNLEDDLDENTEAANTRQLPASEEPEEQETGRDAWDRRRRLPGYKPLTRTGAPIDYSAPLLPVPPPEGEVYLLREALIGIEPTPFNPDTFAGEEEIFVDEKGITKIKPVDRTKIRWRYARRTNPDDGSEEIVPESNARFVRWSDGSVQLMLGDEVFDVVTADISQQRTYMVAYSGVVQGQAALTQKMGFRLATLNSKLHARMREEVDKRTVKVKRVQQHVEAYDPAKEKERKAREAEERNRNSMSLAARQQRVMARYGGGMGGGAGRGRRGRPELNTRFLEEEDGIEGGDGGFIDDGDEEVGVRRRRMDDAEEEEAARRLTGAKRTGAGAGGGRDRGGAKRRRGQREESEEEEEPELDEEEEEYVDSEGGSEEEEGSGSEGGGGGGGGEDEEEEAGPARRPGSPPQRGQRGPGAPRGASPPGMGAGASQRDRDRDRDREGGRAGGRGGSQPGGPQRGGGGGGGGGGPPAAKVRRGVVLSDDEDD